MKHRELAFFLFLVTILISCNKNNDPPNIDSYKEDSNYLHEEMISGEPDTTKSKLLSFFQSNLENIQQWKTRWDTISKVGEIPIDSIKVIRIDSCKWCYALPVVNQDSLVGIVAASILEDEVKEGKVYRIRLKAESKVAPMEFISPRDTLFYKFSTYFNYYKSVNHAPYKPCTRFLSNRGAYFRFRYELTNHAYEENGEIVVEGGSTSDIKMAIEYFRFCGYKVGDYQIGNGYLMIYFSEWDGENYELLEARACDFAEAINQWLHWNGYLVYIYPTFVPGSGGNSGGSGGNTDGGSIGSGSGSGIGGGGGNDTPSNECKNCTHSKCPICGRCIKNSNGVCEYQSEPYSINVHVSPLTIDLGDDYSLTVMNTSIHRGSIINIEYNIIDFRDNSSIILCSTTSLNNATVKAYRPGHWGIQAVATFKDLTRVESEIQRVTIQNPLYSRIMQEPTVISQIKSLWQMAVQNAESNPPSYKEKGAWIILNSFTNDYELMEVEDSPEFACEGTTSIQFPDPGIVPQYPNKGGRYIVGTFHTHPARTKCDNTKSYLVGPSDVDKNMNTVCLLYEYVGQVFPDGLEYIKGGHKPNASHKLYHCAKERHPLDF